MRAAILLIKQILKSCIEPSFGMARENVFKLAFLLPNTHSSDMPNSTQREMDSVMPVIKKK